MTTKPKAKKFRIRRSTPEDPTPRPEPVTQSTPRPAPRPITSEGVVPPQPVSLPPQGMAGQVSSAAQVAGETDMDAIRREGLTGRQLRMARRVAQKHGLAPTSDFDAVRLLRAKGIDPFQRNNMLELVMPDGEQKSAANVPAQQSGEKRCSCPRPSR